VKVILTLNALYLAMTLSIAAQHGQTAPQPPAANQTTPESTPQLRQKTFEIVWRTVKDEHFDPNMGGVDWDKVREQYAPKVAAVRGDEEFYDLLNRMLGELHQSHLAVIPPEVFAKDYANKSSTGGIGIDLRLIGERAVITQLDSGSAAARAGLRQGFIIKAIDGKAIDQIAERYNSRSVSDDLKRVSITGAILRAIHGQPGSPVRIAYLDATDIQRDVTILREQRKGEVLPAGGGLPPLFTEFESKILRGGIGYIRFNLFIPALYGRINSAIKSMTDAPGIIIDLRGNSGGFGEVVTAVAGLLVNKETVLVTCRRRKGAEEYIARPGKDAYDGPVVILIDGMSLSSAEDFTAGLKESGRVTVVGERSPGDDLEADTRKLPTGAKLMYAIGECATVKGTAIEGHGVIPDREIALDRAMLLKGGDAQLEQAITSIQRQSH
jgi:carboxyl-terminal processing protease